MRRCLPVVANLGASAIVFAFIAKRSGGCGLLEESEDGPVGMTGTEERDYDAGHYARQLRQTFAVRLACAFTPDDYEAVFADPDQMSLFMPALATIRTVLEKKSEAKTDAV